MDKSPYDFIINHKNQDLQKKNQSIHRTFNQIDLNYFIKSLKNIYQKYGGLEEILANKDNGVDLQERISCFKKIFFSINHPERTRKHLPSPLNGSSAKRFNMFLRWMVRSNEKGVDFGLRPGWQAPALCSVGAAPRLCGPDGPRLLPGRGRSLYAQGFGALRGRGLQGLPGRDGGLGWRTRRFHHSRGCDYEFSRPSLGGSGSKFGTLWG